MKDNEKNFTAKILRALNEVTTNEDSEYFIKIEESNVTDFIHALANIVPCLTYQKITGEKTSLLQFNHIANELCFKYMKQTNKTKTK